ncbi:MAG: hypothetical protein O3C40_22820 [Planctomycetota bacterium]|nr:hypothetical protein [Planctomycetota bacterium]
MPPSVRRFEILVIVSSGQIAHTAFVVLVVNLTTIDLIVLDEIAGLIDSSDRWNVAQYRKTGISHTINTSRIASQAPKTALNASGITECKGELLEQRKPLQNNWIDAKKTGRSEFGYGSKNEGCRVVLAFGTFKPAKHDRARTRAHAHTRLVKVRLALLTTGLLNASSRERFPKYGSHLSKLR